MNKYYNYALIIATANGFFWAGHYLGNKRGFDQGISFATTEPKIISALEEKKKCDKWNGDFYFDSRWEIYPLNEEGNYGKIKCNKTYTEGNKEITETLFDYQF